MARRRRSRAAVRAAVGSLHTQEAATSAGRVADYRTTNHGRRSAARTAAGRAEYGARSGPTGGLRTAMATAGRRVARQVASAVPTRPAPGFGTGVESASARPAGSNYPQRRTEDVRSSSRAVATEGRAYTRSPTATGHRPRPTATAAGLPATSYAARTSPGRQQQSPGIAQIARQRQRRRRVPRARMTY